MGRAPCPGVCGCRQELGEPWTAAVSLPSPEIPPREAASKISNSRTSLAEGRTRVRGRCGETLKTPSHCVRPGCGGWVGPKLRDGGFPSFPHPDVSAPGKEPGSHDSCTPPPSPQAWMRSWAGWRESFSLNQYNLPSGSREQICSHLKAASVFPDYEGVSGALSKSRKDHVPKAKQTSSSGGPWRAGQEPRSGWGARVAAALGLGADRRSGGQTSAQRRRSQLGDYEFVPLAFIGS